MPEFSPEKRPSILSLEEPTCDVALRSTTGRLQALLHFFPLAATRANENIEYVHQLRVWTRRSSAAIRLYKRFIPESARKEMDRTLKRLRKAADPARNLDVLIEQLAEFEDPVSRRWRERLVPLRAAAQQHLIAVHEEWGSSGELLKQVEKLLDRMKGRSKKRKLAKPFGTWARRRLSKISEKFVRSVPAAHAPADELHAFRIACKRYRYSLELLWSAFPEKEIAPLAETIELAQDRLGRINDLHMQLAEFDRLLQSMANDANEAANGCVSGRAADLDSERRRLELAEHVRTAEQDFAIWLDGTRIDELQRRIHDLTQSPAAP